MEQAKTQPSQWKQTILQVILALLIILMIAVIAVTQILETNPGAKSAPVEMLKEVYEAEKGHKVP